MKKKITFLFVFFIFDLLRIPKYLRECAVGMLNASMMMNAIAMINDVLLVLFDTLGNIFKQQGVQKIDYVGDVCASRRHCINHVNWARTHQRWLIQQWNSILFSEESRFIIHLGDGTVRITP